MIILNCFILPYVPAPNVFEGSRSRRRAGGTPGAHGGGRSGSRRSTAGSPTACSAPGAAPRGAGREEYLVGDHYEICGKICGAELHKKELGVFLALNDGLMGQTVV